MLEFVSISRRDSFVECKFSHSSSKVENKNKNDKEKISNDKFHDSDCQGCGQFPDEFECVIFSDRFFSECVHMKNIHYCLNFGDDVV